MESVDVEKGRVNILISFFQDISMGGNSSFISRLCIEAKKNVRWCNFN